MFDTRFLEKVMCVPFSTMKSIRHSCQLGFSQALLGALLKVVTKPGCVVALVKVVFAPSVHVVGVQTYERAIQKIGK